MLGGPDVLARGGVAMSDALRAQVAEHATQGRRVVMLCGGRAPLVDERLTDDLRPLGLVLLAEAVRPEAAETIAYLTREGVATRVISGDDPVTVGAVATAVGIPGAHATVSGADLPSDPAELDALVGDIVVYGRITPEQKRDLVQALTRRGHYVAMTGDGVNDVLALKEARLGIAMGNGSQMAKGVADLILLTSSFATVPRAVEEGRRILRNTHRVAKLFVAKTVYSAVILATLGLAPIAYPFLPRQITVASTLTIGVPAFFLALAPSSGPVRREGFLRSLLAFVVPAGVISAATIIAAYLIVRGPSGRGHRRGAHRRGARHHGHGPRDRHRGRARTGAAEGAAVGVGDGGGVRRRADPGHADPLPARLLRRGRADQRGVGGRRGLPRGGHRPDARRAPHPVAETCGERHGLTVRGAGLPKPVAGRSRLWRRRRRPRLGGP